MASSALGVVSLDQAKFELRIDGDDQNADITNVVASAVEWVQVDSGLPLIDDVMVLHVDPASRSDLPVLLETNYVLSAQAAYWTQSSEGQREDPDAYISGLGRLVPSSMPRATWLWPPDEGWPGDRKSGTPIQVTATRGFTTTPPLAVSCCLSMLRLLWDGTPNIPGALEMQMNKLREMV